MTIRLTPDHARAISERFREISPLSSALPTPGDKLFTNHVMLALGAAQAMSGVPGAAGISTAMPHQALHPSPG